MDHITQAAYCLLDDPTFRQITNLEAQREEARAALAAIGGDVNDADDVVMLALDMAAGVESESLEVIAVPRADYADGVWRERKVQVRRPRLVAFPDPWAEKPPRKPKRARGKGKKYQKRKPKPAPANTILAGYVAAMGVSAESLSPLLGKKRPTVTCYVLGRLPYRPRRSHLDQFRKDLLERRTVIEQLLDLIDATERTLPFR